MVTRGAARCDAVLPRAAIRIDPHCHILNLRDISAGPFVVRRFLNYDEAAAPGFDAIAGAIVGTVADVLKITTKTTSFEHGNLRNKVEKSPGKPPFIDATDFCEFAENNQSGPFKANSDRQLTGVFSRKYRNAARLSEIYPDFDIFMPSIVDLYDDRRSMTSIGQQIEFYSMLNLSTAGRFLPMVSFNPQRHYDLKMRFKLEEQNNYLAFVKDAVLNRGFIGVKVHPSSGFSPAENLTYGCSNTATQIVTENDQELYDRFTAYDALMAELFDFCAAADVPILTHGSDGISANQRCMRGPRLTNGTKRPSGPMADPSNTSEWRYLYRKWGRIGGEDNPDELEWTNSPRIWDKISRKHKVNVIISHFANAMREERLNQRDIEVRISDWLVATAQAVNTNPYLYVDLSIITEFFAEDDNAPLEYRLREGHKKLFARLIRRFPKLKRQMIYGSDWHMPATARVGARYSELIEELLRYAKLSEREIDLVMGERAATLFGLRRGGQNRKRLEEFYVTEGARRSGRPYDLRDIKWMRKL